MSVTVKELLGIPGLPLKLLAGAAKSASGIRWVHSTELEDPTPWLKGGEIVLTTGMGVGTTPAKQKAYVKRLAEAGAAGMGFGLGFTFDKVPKTVVSTAEEAGLPLFEVPYPVPFIAITEAVFSRILASQYDSLQRAVDAEHSLTRAVLEGKGIQGIAESLAVATRGWVLLLDMHGIALAATSKAASGRGPRIWQELLSSRPDGSTFSLSIMDKGHHIWVQPVGAQGRTEAFLAVGKPEQPSHMDQIVAGHALSLLAIELAKSQAIADAQRRLQGDFLDELAGGGISASDAARGLARFGFEKETKVVAVALEGGEPDQIARILTDERSRSGSGFLVSAHSTGVNLLLPESASVELGGLIKAMKERSGALLRAGAGSAVAAVDTGRSLREAKYALQVCRLEGWDFAGFGDLGTYRLLLSMADPDALRAFADSLLAPLDTYDLEQKGELMNSLQSFLLHNARWETAAAELYVHRHTLRYRMRKVEELTGRDLSNSFDRMEFWLALRARDLQADASA